MFLGGDGHEPRGRTMNISQSESNASSGDDQVDHQLDALISRIQSLTGGNGDPAPSGGSADSSEASAPAAPKQQPRPAAGTMPVVRPPSGPQSGPDGTPSAGPTANPSPAPPQRPSAGPAGMPQTGPSSQPAAVGPQPTSRGNAPAGGTSQRSGESSTEDDVPRPAAAVPARSLEFEPTRDEPWRPQEPVTIEDGGINESLLEAIIYRYLLNVGESEGRKVADQVKVPFRLIEPLLGRLKMEQHVAYKSSTATNDYVYVLTESGRGIARNHLSDCTYYGACPVRLSDYIESVGRQTIEGQHPKKPDLKRAFEDLLINPKMLNRLGPAVASGRGMFLYGFPGNGKTSIAERVTGAFGKYLWIPRAIEIDGEIMRVFDPMNHELAMPQGGSGLLDTNPFDKRWVRIKRPTIVAGGELTMDMLEVMSNRESGISEAPLQLKSNCGTLVIDDFGRQKMSVDQLLNRWIIPLEKRYDFLNMPSGKKIQVPFDQLVIFSTNLEPRDLVDDAFLRRIPYKIEIGNPPEADFRKLFEIMCRVLEVPYDADAIDYLIQTHYVPVERPFRNCQPRDLLLQVRNYCLYNDLEVELKKEYFDFACDNYFSVM